MKIAVIANEARKREILFKPLPAGVEWVWVDSVQALAQQKGTDLYIDLDFTYDRARIEQLGQLLPKPVIINSVIYTIREIGLPFIRINAWPGFLAGEITELAAINGKEAAGQIDRFFKALGWQYRILPDIPGMVSPRILSMIVNEAYYTLQDRVSTKAGIDTAMKLGTNYPFGPFEWSERIGLKNISELLAVLVRTDKRYEAAEMLKADSCGNVKI